MNKGVIKNDGRHISISSDTLELTFDDILNVPVADPLDVNDWNAFFDLPTNGTPFTSVIVDGNAVTLYGGSGITLKDSLFGGSAVTATSLLEVVDTGCVIACGDGVFGDWPIGLGCYGITKIHLPSCATLGSFVFYNCILLNDLILSFSDITTLGDWTFYNCTNLYDPDFSSLITAGDGCFYGCQNLISLDWSSLTTVGNACFEDCINLTDPDFSSLITVGGDCFMGCTGLYSTDFSSLITAGNASFWGCVWLDSPDFSSLTTAGNDCFGNCSGLVSPDFSSLTTIGQYCFKNCTSLISINIPVCTDLGGTTGDDDVFDGIIGNIITLTVPLALMTCNGGNPDGDIQYLQANNTVTIITV